MTTVAVLPVKRLGEAKQRLGDALGAVERRALAEAMVGDVLDALTGAAAVDAIVVVTGEPAAVALAAAAGAATVADPDDAGHVRAARRGVTWALQHGATRALLVPGDCPALDPDEIDGLLAAASGADRAAGSARGRAGGEVIVVPDRHGTGTNALVLTPPDAIVPSFGPGSRARHEQAAGAAGARARVAEPPSLLLDVDTPDDLDALRAALGRRPGGAVRTRAVLAGLAP
jgi:2-phospho-L-lactate/phosphoenolpyruvate guanylyltransferase